MPEQNKITPFKKEISPEEQYSTTKKKKKDRLFKLLNEVLDLPEERASLDMELVLRLIAEHSHKHADIKDIKDLGYITEKEVYTLSKKIIDSFNEALSNSSANIREDFALADNELKTDISAAQKKHEELAKYVKSLKIPTDVSEQVQQLINDLSALKQTPTQELDSAALEESIFAKLKTLVEGSEKVVYVSQGYTSSNLSRLVDVFINDQTLANNDVLKFDATLQRWVNGVGGGGGTGIANEETIEQEEHGFGVGDVIYYNGTEYELALADDVVTAEAIGIVSEVADADAFTVVYSGRINDLAGLTPGETYFLSDATPGLLTATAPTAVGSVVKPLLIATSETSGVVVNLRGNIITDPSGAFIFAVTANDTLTAANTGNTYTNEGATALITLTLPTAALGYEFEFIVVDTDGIRVQAAAGDNIRVGSEISGTAQYIQSAKIGSVVKIKAVNSTNWVAVSSMGTWSVQT